MEKSIENIWTKGFLKEEAAVIPKINNLYQKKSELLIDKMKRTYKTDNKSILPLGILLFIGLGVMNHWLTGVYVLLLLLGIFFLNRRKLAALDGIRIDQTSYAYLLQYRAFLRDLTKYYTRLLGLGFPFAGVAGYLIFFWKNPLLDQLFHMKFLLVVGVFLGIIFLLSAIGILAYRLSLRLIYGQLLKKLDEIISDMAELQDQNPKSL